MAEDKDLIIRHFDGELPEPLREAQGDVIKCAVVSLAAVGTNPRRAKVIELYAGIFEADETGFTKKLQEGLFFGDPGEPLPEVLKSRGYKAEELEGREIDEAALQELFEGVELVVAYNAGFVRPVLERFVTGLEETVFACARNQVDWTGKGFECRALNHLAKDLGWYIDDRRSRVEAMAVVKLLNEVDPDTGKCYFAEMRERSAEPLILVHAHAHPDERRWLRKEFFRWSSNDNAWTRLMGVSTYKRVKESLESKGFSGQLVEVDRHPACDRFR